MSKSGAKEPPQYPHKDPILGIDLFLEYKKAFEEGRFLTTTLRHFENFGDTFKANSFGTTVIKTRDPRVSKAFHATQFEKFGLQPLRYENSKDLFGNSIIMVDGPAWAHARALIRPSFETVHIANFERLNRHVDRFMSLLPKDSSTVDLFPLFKLLILDTSSDFIFGESMDALSFSPGSKDFIEAFAYAQRGIAIRHMLGKFRFLYRNKDWKRSCRTVVGVCDGYVEKALIRLRSQDEEKLGGDKSHQRLRLIDEMAKETQDPYDLRSQMVGVFSPAHDGAAVTLSNTFFHLSRRPEEWARLRAEILPTKDEPITYELLVSYKYVEKTLRETHRITTIATFNQRQCLSTTVIPFGGGPAGEDPLLVSKGDVVEVYYRAMHFRKDIWGDDADEYRPDRWETARPEWAYTPFGGGSRICPGQRLVYTESAYVLVRMLREFERLENRDPEMEWQEEMRMTFQSKNGTIVGLFRE